ncbi:MAG: hypothetical protein AAFO29_07150 [Actinomycetota bacterium]
MTDHPTSPRPRPDPPEPIPGTFLEPGRPVSVDDVPADWRAAEQQAPASLPATANQVRRAKRATVPVRREGTFVANVVAAATGFIGASTWYLLDLLGIYQGPWTPVAIALAIGVAIRSFSRANPTHRSVVSTLTYLLVLLSVLILLTHRDLVSIYGAIEDYRIYEQSIVRSRLQDPLHLAAYGIGGILAAIVPAIGERR